MRVPREEAARAHVRREHAFLDQAVRVVARLGHDALDLALGVEQHPRLDGLEVDRAAPVARLEQHLEHGVEVLQLLVPLRGDSSCQTLV